MVWPRHSLTTSCSPQPTAAATVHLLTIFYSHSSFPAAPDMYKKAKDFFPLLDGSRIMWINFPLTNALTSSLLLTDRTKPKVCIQAYKGLPPGPCPSLQVTACNPQCCPALADLLTHPLCQACSLLQILFHQLHLHLSSSASRKPPAVSPIRLHFGGSVLVTQSRPTLCDPMDCSPPGSSVHGILQARVLERAARPSSSWRQSMSNWCLFSQYLARQGLGSKRDKLLYIKYISHKDI